MKDNQTRLTELIEKKKKQRLSPQEYKEFKSLMKNQEKNGSDASNSHQNTTKFVPGNDFSWWNKHPELMNDAANLKCNWIAGTPLIQGHAGNVNIAGVLKVRMLNSYGSEISVTDPINMAARNIYLKMFSKFRGISSYEASDLGITFISTIEVFQLIGKLERIYGTINQYAILNRNVPTAVVQALGLTQTQADYIRGHLSDYRYDLNNLILKAQRIVLPRDMSILANRLSLYSYLYLDHMSERAQIIVFDYDRYGVFDETTFESGGSVTFVTPSDLHLNLIDFTGSANVMFPFLDEMLNRLLTSESVIKMYGDLLAYFGPEQMVTLLPLPAEYVLSPIYSESILHKLHNSETLGYGDSGINDNHIWMPVEVGTLSAADKTTLENLSRPVVYQSEGVIITKCTLCMVGLGTWETISGTMKGRVNAASCFNSNITHILDAYRSDFTPETVCEGVLWKYGIAKFFTSTGSSPYEGYVFTTLGTELIVNFEIFTNDLGSVSSKTTSSWHVEPDENEVITVLDLQVVDWAPLTYLMFNTSDDDAQILKVFGDVDNARAIDFHDVYRIQRAALLSSFRSDVTVISAK